MKSRIQNLFLVLACTGFLAMPAAAQTFTNLYRFAGYPTDGANPHCGLVLSGNTLYGTTYGGGNSGSSLGTVFKVNTDGSGYTLLKSFNGGSDGALPNASLIVSGNTLYGTTEQGGSSGNGTLFRINIDGTSFTNLYRFTSLNNSTNSDGANPEAGLILSGNTLYGTAYHGGNSGFGTVFAVNTDGTSFTNLHSFKQGGDGASPYAGLILSGNTLYGTTYQGGGDANVGIVFCINTNGMGFTNLYTFTGGTDGGYPNGLILLGNAFYGTAVYDGSGFGTVFKINMDGSGFTVLKSFNGGSDGRYPEAGLILSGNTLYGTTTYSGSGGGWHGFRR